MIRLFQVRQAGPQLICPEEVTFVGPKLFFGGMGELEVSRLADEDSVNRRHRA